MDDVRFGSAVRAVRIRKRWRQCDVAEKAKVSQVMVSRIERGQVGDMTLDRIRAVARALEVSVPLSPRWRGGELDRLVNRAHAALHEEVARRLQRLTAWTVVPEVAFAIGQERGVIDILAWHAATKSLLVIELKTLLVDPQDLVKTMGVRRRLGPRIGREQGWDAATVGAWVVVTDTRTNRRHVAAVATMLRNAFPSDGHAIGAWLRRPSGSISALSFWPSGHAVVARRVGRSRIEDAVAPDEPDHVDDGEPQPFDWTPYLGTPVDR
jgi:transcriptional regulator with XRE-family HTH domain